MNEELTMAGQQPPKRRRATKLALAAGVATIVSLGAIAFAAIPDAGTGVFHGCYDRGPPEKSWPPRVVRDLPKTT